MLSPLFGREFFIKRVYRNNVAMLFFIVRDELFFRGMFSDPVVSRVSNNRQKPSSAFRPDTKVVESLKSSYIRILYNIAGTLVEEVKQVDLHFEWGRGFNKKDDTGGTFYRSTGLKSAMASGRMPL